MFTNDQGRYFISNKIWDEEFSDSWISDQKMGKSQPPLEKPFVEEGLLPLPDPLTVTLKKKDITSIIHDRKSRRVFTDEEITSGELSYLLWASQGIKEIMANNYATLRTVPSAGARHPFETYLYINRVSGIEKGIYRYVASRHSLSLLKAGNFSDEMTEANLGQQFVGNSAVTFLWSVIPYRTEWRYNLHSYKVILMDAGHVCQNLYIACEALRLGTCAIGAYSHEKINRLLNLEGEDEFVVYLAPVGRYRERRNPKWSWMTWKEDCLIRYMREFSGGKRGICP